VFVGGRLRMGKECKVSIRGTRTRSLLAVYKVIVRA